MVEFIRLSRQFRRRGTEKHIHIVRLETDEQVAAVDEQVAGWAQSWLNRAGRYRIRPPGSRLEVLRLEEIVCHVVVLICMCAVVRNINIKLLNVNENLIVASKERTPNFFFFVFSSTYIVTCKGWKGIHSHIARQQVFDLKNCYSVGGKRVSYWMCFTKARELVDAK